MAITFVRNLPMSAASGLVRIGATSFIVADDEQDLHILRDGGPDLTLPLFGEPLPAEPKARKQAKPDFEALCRWPGDGDALLVLGSGSGDRRHRGCLIARVSGEPSRMTVTAVDLAPLHAHLAGFFAALNLEAAAVVGDALVLAQRGNGRDNASGLVLLDRARVADALARGAAWGPDLVRRVDVVDLGTRGPAALAFTDLSPLSDGTLAFVAAAEDTADTYNDGALTGVTIGRLDRDRRPLWLTDVSDAAKLEGIHAELADDRLAVWLVADPDDPTLLAPLYTATLDAATGIILH